MHPLVARVARAFGYGDAGAAGQRAEEERLFDLDKAYLVRLEVEQEASPAFRQAMDDDPSFMYVAYPGEPSAAWDAYLVALAESAAMGDARGAGQPESPRRDTGLER